MALALAAELAIAGLELAIEEVYIGGLLIVGPLLGAIRVSPRLTALLGWVALALAAALSVVVDTMGGDRQEAVGVIVVAAGSLLALWISILRAQREAAARRLLAQHAVARVGAESATLTEAAPGMLEAIGRTLGWDLGMLWEVDRDAGVLRRVATWSTPETDVAAFDGESAERTFERGAGLPGRVWDTGRAAWIVELQSDPNFPRAPGAIAAGLCSAFAFPLRARNEVVGAMEFFSRERRAPDTDLLRQMETFGTQVGTYVEVKRAEEAVRSSDALKTGILDAALDCIVTMDDHGCVVEFNPAAERTFGYRRDEAIGREMAELIVPPQFREAHREGLRRQVEGGPGAPSAILDQRLELSAVRADGTEFPVELTVTRIDRAGPPIFTGYVRDITARVRAEEDLRRSRDQLEATLGHLADGVTVEDPDGTIVYANAAAVRQAGAEGPHELVGRHGDELLERLALRDEDGEPVAVASLPGPRARAGEEVEDTTVRHRDPASGEERWSLLRASVVRDADGSVVLVVNVFEDVTETRRAEAAQRFLAEASRVLGASLDYEATLENVARLAVPEVADWCAVDVAGPGGRIERVALAHVDPEMVARAHELRRRYPVGASQGDAVARVIESGEPALHRDVPDSLLREHAVDDEHYELLRALQPCSAIIVPLRGLDRTLGVLTFASSESGRRFDEADLVLAQQLAQRAATAIENARVYSERAQIAQTLQRSLLPPTLPMIPGLELAARYRAAGEATEVGGDFYDVFELGSSRWAIVMGDVCGKGAEAAAITALARYTVRALAMHEASPRRVLELLNEALLRQRSDRQFCTVAYVVVTVGEGGRAMLEVACGGHPPPLVVAPDGSVAAASESGTLLGVVEDPDVACTTLELRPGELLLLYTDGVTDARVDDARFFGTERLFALAGDAAGEDAARAAERIEAAVTSGGGALRDDLAVLVLRNAPGSSNGSQGAVPTLAERGNDLEVRLPATSDAVGLARRAIEPLAEDLDVRVDDLRLLVSELVTNGVRHGSDGDLDWIGLTVTRSGAGLRVQVTDPGPGFAREARAREPEGEDDRRHQVGGWGLYLVEQIADRWGVQRGDRTTVWFELDPPAAGAAGDP
jgi:PAS domain S-box-containing protein